MARRMQRRNVVKVMVSVAWKVVVAVAGSGLGNLGADVAVRAVKCAVTVGVSGDASGCN